MKAKKRTAVIKGHMQITIDERDRVVEEIRRELSFMLSLKKQSAFETESLVRCSCTGLNRLCSLEQYAHRARACKTEDSVRWTFYDLQDLSSLRILSEAECSALCQ